MGGLGRLWERMRDALGGAFGQVSQWYQGRETRKI